MNFDPSRRLGDILMFGGGKMGSALLKGWLEAGLSFGRVTVIDPRPGPDLLALRERIVIQPPRQPCPAADVVIAAVKPQQFGEIRAAIAEASRPGGLLISIMAGVRLGSLRTALPDAAGLVRAMPNLAVRVGRGVVVAHGVGLTQDQRETAGTLLSCSGIFEWVEEEGLLDAATALSGSGPAYVLLLAEVMSRIGRESGLPEQLADRLARMVFTGTGELLLRSPLSPGELRNAIASPGGATEAALDRLTTDDALYTVVASAMRAAQDKGKTLGETYCGS